MEYIHYGSTTLLPIKPIVNENYFTKPKGGLWASPVNAKFGWDDWCKREHFRKNTKENSFRFVLKDNAKILHIYSVADLDALPKQKVDIDSGLMCYLDFEKIEKDYDGVELHLSEEKFGDNDICSGLYFKLYGWDCDSIIIFHNDAIKIIS